MREDDEDEDEPSSADHPKLVFKSAPARVFDEDVADSLKSAVKDFKVKYGSEHGVTSVREDRDSSGNFVLRVQCKSIKKASDKIPATFKGFKIVLTPQHTSLAEDDTDKEADSLVNPLPNRPENGRSKGREYPPEPYLDQVSGPPSMNDELVVQVRDLPKGR